MNSQSVSYVPNWRILMANHSMTLFIILIVVSVSASQPPDTLWTRTYDMTGLDAGRAVQVTGDGGYIVAGSCRETYYEDIWVLRLDSQGDLLWEVIVGEDTEIEVAYSVRNTSDGGFVVVGETSAEASGLWDFYMLKLDSAGNIEWEANYGTIEADHARDVIQTRDSGYLLVGYLHHTGYNKDIVVVKTDSLGTMEWTERIATINNESAESVLLDSNGEYVIGGWCVAESDSASDYYTIWLDGTGGITRQAQFGGLRNDFGCSICKGDSGGYVIAGYSYSFGNGSQGYVVGIDDTGSVLWDLSSGGADDDMLFSIIGALYSGYVATGSSESTPGEEDVWLIRIDPSGNMDWEASYDCGQDEWAESVAQTSDGGFILCGSSIQASGSDILLLRTTPLVGINHGDLPLIGSTLMVSSNPSGRNPEFTVIVEEECSIDLNIHDTSGRVVCSVFSGFLNAGSHTVSAGELPSGLYIARLSTGGENSALKFTVIN